MTSHAKVLYIPWYPSSFFEEQSQLLSDEYPYKVLMGNVSFVGRRARLIRFIKRKANETFSLSSKNGIPYVSLTIPKYVENRGLKQIETSVEYVGKVIADLFGGQKPQIIHIQSLSDFSVFAAIWAKRNNVPVVLSEHILYVRRDFSPFTRLKERQYSESNRILCVSNYQYRNLLTNGFVMNDVSIVGNMIDDRFVPKDIETKERNGKLLFVAYHLGDKCFDVLMALASMLKGVCSIDVAGLDENREYKSSKLIDLLKEKGVDKTITLMGMYNHEDLLKLYSEYSLLISTSRSETFGLSVAEAIAYGTPVVCTDSGGIHEFVNDENGIIVDIGDVNGLKDAIFHALNKKYDRKCMSQRILMKYGREQFKKKLLNIYSSL